MAKIESANSRSSDRKMGKAPSGEAASSAKQSGQHTPSSGNAVKTRIGRTLQYQK